MAVTEIHSISSTVGLAIKYIINPDKTNNGRLVSTIGCHADGDLAEKEFDMIRHMGTGMGEVLAKHLVQSFKPGEVTPEQAHLLGIQLADKLLKGKYQYVLATHIDKDHIHNHLIFNNIDSENFRSFEYQENRGGKVFENIRQISDNLCRENNLSVIENPELGKGKSYYEWQMNKENLSWKARLKYEIDNAVMNSTDFSSFLNELTKRNIEYVYKPENVISLKFRMAGQQKFTRAKTLGWYYEESQLKRRIENYNLLKTGRSVKPIKSKFIDTSEEKFQQSKYFERWADIQNMKEASKLINFLAEHDISDRGELEEKSISKYGERMKLVASLNELQLKIDNYTQTIKEISMYLKYKPYSEQLKKAAFKKKFEKKNAAELEKFNSVKKILSEKFPDKKLPTLEHLYDERAELIAQRNEKNTEYKKLVKELKDLDNARSQIDEYIRSQSRDIQQKRELE